MSRTHPLHSGSALLLMAVAVLAAPPIAHAEDKAIGVSGKDQPARNWALIIGINGYTQAPLRYCVKDATLLADTLKGKCSYDATRVYLLTDGQKDFKDLPTRNNILDTARIVADLTRESDTLLVYFSGHGVTVEGKGYLVPIDARRADAAGELVAIAELRDILRQAKAARRVLVLDACHSGGEKAGADAGMTKSFEDALKANAEGLVTLASCRASETSLEADWHNQGLFTYWLVQGLAGQADREEAGNRDGKVEVNELYTFVYEHVRAEAAEDRFHHQNPFVLAALSGKIELAQVSVEVVAAAALAHPESTSPSQAPIGQGTPGNPPVIALATPRDNVSVSARDIQVRGVVADDGQVERVEATLNGRPIERAGGRAIGLPTPPGEPAGREVTFDFMVSLVEGRNEIRVVARDDAGLTAEKHVTVTFAPDTGDIYVVCIGIDAYRSVPRLRYAAADARAMAERLQRRLKVPERNVTVVTDSDATLTKIRDVLGVRVRERAGSEDTVIIFFSGHGAPEADPQSQDGDGVAKYLLPVEADPASLYSTALPMDEVRTIFRRLTCERVIFLADTCYSGAAGGRSLTPDGSTAFRSVNQDQLLARLRDTGKGRAILTASQGAEVSQEKAELGHGVFTYFLLKGLDGEADRDRDGAVTITELYEYVSREVPAATRNTQHPSMKLDALVGDMVVGVVGK